MFVYSTWMIATADEQSIDGLAHRLATEETLEHRDESGVLWTTFVDFRERSEAPWLVSEGAGRRRWGLAHLPSKEGIEQLVGVIAPSEAWLAALGRDVTIALAELGIQYEPVGFSMSTLLGAQGQSQGLVPRTVRLAGGDLDVVLQSVEEELLRAGMAERSESIAGVTFALEEQQVTAFEDGTVVFADDADPAGLLRAMHAIQSALVTRSLAW